MRRAALSHRPTPLTTVKRNIKSAMIFRIALRVLAGSLIIGRKHTADKADNRQSVLAVITERVNIPPAITVLVYGRIKARSCNSASAARIPANAAIGTPGPGCVLPPAR